MKWYTWYLVLHTWNLEHYTVLYFKHYRYCKRYTETSGKQSFCHLGSTQGVQLVPSNDKGNMQTLKCVRTCIRWRVASPNELHPAELDPAAVARAPEAALLRQLT